jgi:hypothetical protein
MPHLQGVPRREGQFWLSNLRLFVHHGQPPESRWTKLGMTMRKSALVLAAVMAASFSTAALAAKKKAPPPDPATQAQQDTANFLGAMVHPASQPEPPKPVRHRKKASSSAS